MDLGKLLTLVQTLELHKEQAFQLMEESRKDKKRLDLLIAELNRRLEEGHKESIVPATREIQGTCAADSEETDEKTEE